MLRVNKKDGTNPSFFVCICAAGDERAKGA